MGEEYFHKRGNEMTVITDFRQNDNWDNGHL